MVRKTLIALSLLAVLACASLALAQGGAGEAWNDHAAEYNFRFYPQAPTVTFAQAYQGSDFAGDFAGILHAVSTDLNKLSPPLDDDDMLNVSLEDWESGPSN